MLEVDEHETFNSASVGVTRTSVLAMRISIYLPNQEPQDLMKISDTKFYKRIAILSEFLGLLSLSLSSTFQIFFAESHHMCVVFSHLVVTTGSLAGKFSLPHSPHQK